METARQGNAGARGELVRRYQRRIALVAAALVNDLAEGEDLGQEAFVPAFHNLDLLVDPSRFGAWLRRIAFGGRSTGSAASGPSCIALLSPRPPTGPMGPSLVAQHAAVAGLRGATAVASPAT